MQVVVILYCLGISFLEFFFHVGIFDLQLVECGTQRNRRPAWLSQRWCLSKICGENPYRALSVRTGEVSGAHDSHQSSVTPNSETHLSYSPRILRRWAGSLSRPHSMTQPARLSPGTLSLRRRGREGGGSGAGSPFVKASLVATPTSWGSQAWF